MPFYAVAKGRTSGIFMNWGDCEAQVKGFSGAKYKKFNTVVEAQDYIAAGGITKKIPSQKDQSSNNEFALANNTGNNNLKRTYSSSAKSKNNQPPVPAKKSKEKRRKDSSDSIDDDLGLSSIVVKQLDDIEARLKGVTKNVDNIVKKNTKVVGRKTQLIDQQDIPQGFQTDHEGYVQVYTDGACSANGRSGARAGLGVYWGEGSSLNISEPVSGRATNNCGEIQAASKAIQQAIDNGINRLAINTDSKFLINSATKWMSGWKRNGWKLKSGEPVKNEVDFKQLDRVLNKIDVKWIYVEAHRGIHGNERADQLAKAGASKYGFT
ncbi:unnamed protein product [Leptosia nina]|uniref:Ribonuclease H1 n=1 Tax=Leptosia nina TaxID=320188 RepID=A0AAV1JI51_9NEOP